MAAVRELYPPPPNFLKGVAGQVWRRIIPDLQKNGIYEPQFQHLLAVACSMFARYLDLSDMVRNGRGDEWITLADGAKTTPRAELPHVHLLARQCAGDFHLILEREVPLFDLNGAVLDSELLAAFGWSSEEFETDK